MGISGGAQVVIVCPSSPSLNPRMTVGSGKFKCLTTDKFPELRENIKYLFDFFYAYLKI
jgi:hypothetical protein